MRAIKLCKQYLEAVTERNLDAVLGLFHTNATVTAPLSGETGVREFHERLFDSETRSQTTVKNIFATVNDVSCVALQFVHTWTLQDGRKIEFEGVDVFELTRDGMRFSRLTILYDSAPVRQQIIQSGMRNPFLR